MTDCEKDCRKNDKNLIKTLDESGEAKEFFKFETKSRVSRLLIRLVGKRKNIERAYIHVKNPKHCH